MLALLLLLPPIPHGMVHVACSQMYSVQCTVVYTAVDKMTCDWRASSLDQ
jgi:hypothetical protein